MRKLLLAAGVDALPFTAHAAGVFVAGSQFTVSGSNTPGTVLAFPAPSIIDGVIQQVQTSIFASSLELVVNETPDGTPGGEWISFSYSVAPAGFALTGNIC